MDHTQQANQKTWGAYHSTGVTCGCVREPGSLTLPILVGFVGFSTSSKNQQTPRQSCGTQVRVFFAMRKQYTIQVKSVEGAYQVHLIIYKIELSFAAYICHERDTFVVFVVTA
jgi:hypothetical protein